MALTQDQIAAQMVAQLRVLDPSVSAEIGTPERKIIDTVAQAIAESQVDLNLLGGALDLDAKFGRDLDTFVGLFGFGRQSGSFSTGFVTFGRTTPSAFDIVIPAGTQVQGNTTVNNATFTVTFQTSAAVTLAANAIRVIAPIQALINGSQGNLAANTITQFANIGAPPPGITSVNNDVPTSGGAESESDAELKVRFRNTVFRNLAGTEDQYMALAVATQFSTKANVIGPISRYKEYVQVPLVDDSQSEAPTTTISATATNGTNFLTSVVNTGSGTPGINMPIAGTGLAAGTVITDITGTAFTLSANYTGLTGAASFTITTGQPDDGPGNGQPGQWTTTPSNNPFAKYIYANVPYFVSNGSIDASTIFYRQDTDFVLNAPPLNAGDTFREFTESPPDIPDPATTPYRPNVTFFNVYTGSDDTVALPRPGGVPLVEYSYLSAESRNDVTRNITNCVDVYVNGQNPITTDSVIPPPPGGINLFTSNSADKFYNQNFRRIGQPDVAPTVGHIFTALFWQPVIGLPDQIVVGDNTYFLGTQYWAVEDKTLLGNTVRTRNGIEWNPTANGMTTGDPEGGPYTGATITATGVSSITIVGYTYDKNVIDLQAALDASKQITTDVLAHRAVPRYFKLDLTVVYAPGAGGSATNAAIETSITTFFNGQYFGSTIQLSDLLLVVRNTNGVQNVRWTNDVINPTDEETNTLNRVTECDVNGNPRSPAVVYNTDFYLRDNELPVLPTGQIQGDSLPGLIIRPRAQNTFNIV